MTLRDLRKRRGLSLEAVSYLSGLDISTLSRIERGLHEPRRESVVSLARGFKISVARMRSIVEETGRAAVAA